MEIMERDATVAAVNGSGRALEQAGSAMHRAYNRTAGFYIVAAIADDGRIIGLMTHPANEPLPEGTIVVGSGLMQVGSYKFEKLASGRPVPLWGDAVLRAYELLGRVE